MLIQQPRCRQKRPARLAGMVLLTVLPLIAQTCETPFTTLSDLEDDASAWGGYEEGSPVWSIEPTTQPALSEVALTCALLGGQGYSNIHCYRNLPAVTTATEFKLSLDFYFSPPTTYNNQGSPSGVQALEFTMNSWVGGLRYEWALQWENVGSGAPQWRYWDPASASRWVSLGLPGTLSGETWHRLLLEGSIQDGQVHYQQFAVDDVLFPLGLTVAPAAASGQTDRLAVAIQLDGNAFETPWETVIDTVTLSYR